jgi:hypothetical protein
LLSFPQQICVSLCHNYACLFGNTYFMGLNTQSCLSAATPGGGWGAI